MLATSLTQGGSKTLPFSTQDTPRHPDLWFKDGNLVLKAYDSPILFNLYRGALEECSGYFEGALANSEEDKLEGAQSVLREESENENVKGPQPSATQPVWAETSGKGTIDSPLCLTIKFEELDLVGRWTCGKLKRPVPFEKWLLLLEASEYLLIKDIKTEAVQELTPQLSTNLPPAHIVYLARRFQVKEWLPTGLRLFLSTPPTSLTANDITDVGASTMLAYIRLQHNLGTFRTALALWPPPLKHHKSCTDAEQQRCKAAWGKWWHSNISPVLIADARDGKSVQDTYEKVLRKLRIAVYGAQKDVPEYPDDTIAGMTRKCQADAVEKCISEEAFTQESTAIDTTVGAIIAEEEKVRSKATDDQDQALKDMLDDDDVAMTL